MPRRRHEPPIDLEWDDSWRDSPSMYGPPAPGGRRAALLKRRRRRKRGWATALVVAAALFGAVLYRASTDQKSPEGTGDVDQVVQVGKDDGVTTTLIWGTHEQDGDRAPAVWITLLSFDRKKDRGAVVYIPAGTAVEVPGRGLQGVGSSLASGGVPLMLISAENLLLGLRIDSHVELSDRDARVLFDALDPLTVDVPAEVRVPAGSGQARLLFEEGPASLSSSFLIRLLYTVGIDSDDEELGARHLALWSSLLDAYHDEPEVVGRAFRKAQAALEEGPGTSQGASRVVEALVALSSRDVDLASIPARQVSVGGTELYETDEAELARFVEETIGVSPSARDEIRVQILNGNGTPGIGQQVARKLVGEGFRVILSGNARRLNYRKTLIVTYDSSDQGLATAERAKALVGTGEVQIATQEQGIVDITIVVGRDFPRRP